MRQEVGETREASRLELWRRASRRGDLEAWAAFQQSLEEMVLTWFHAHPSCEAASRVQSESHFVARAFEQLWRLLDGEECPKTSEIWNRLQAELPDQREQRLAYLLYHCGLQPSEIVRCCPQEWSDVHEVARLRRSILMRLMQRSVLAPTAWKGEIPPASTPSSAEGRA